jgi:anti-sigma factor RsiW
MIWTCERFEGSLEEHLAGELPAPQRLQFALHWLVCRACRWSLASYRRTVALVRSAFDDEDRPAPPG